MKKRKTILACLLCLLWAGCSSVPAQSNNMGNSKPASLSGSCALKTCSPKSVRYHYEVVTEYFDGGTSFLTLVQDKAP